MPSEQSFDEVLDGQRTGRFSLTQLSKVEKTYIGTRVEHRDPGTSSTFSEATGWTISSDGQEVDAKWSIRSGGWMIPTEAVGELCLCMTADDDRSTFSAGIVRAEDGNLGTSANKDKKRRFNDQGIAAMAWLANPGDLPENLLLHLSEETRAAILDYDLKRSTRA